MHRSDFNKLPKSFSKSIIVETGLPEFKKNDFDSVQIWLCTKIVNIMSEL